MHEYLLRVSKVCKTVWKDSSFLIHSIGARYTTFEKLCLIC